MGVESVLWKCQLTIVSLFYRIAQCLDSIGVEI